MIVAPDLPGQAVWGRTGGLEAAGGKPDWVSKARPLEDTGPSQPPNRLGRCCRGAAGPSQALCGCPPLGGGCWPRPAHCRDGYPVLKRGTPTCGSPEPVTRSSGPTSTRSRLLPKPSLAGLREARGGQWQLWCPSCSWWGSSSSAWWRRFAVRLVRSRGSACFDLRNLRLTRLPGLPHACEGTDARSWPHFRDFAGAIFRAVCPRPWHDSGLRSCVTKSYRACISRSRSAGRGSRDDQRGGGSLRCGVPRNPPGEGLTRWWGLSGAAPGVHVPRNDQAASAAPGAVDGHLVDSGMVPGDGR